MRQRDVLEIWSSFERLLTDGLWVMSWRTDSMLSMLLTVRDRPGSIRNCAKCFKSSDNKANTARWNMICINSIHSESHYNWTVALKIKLNCQSSLNNNRQFIHFLNYAVKFIVIFSMYDKKGISRLSAFEWCKYNYHRTHLKSSINL